MPLSQPARTAEKSRKKRGEGGGRRRHLSSLPQERYSPSWKRKRDVEEEKKGDYSLSSYPEKRKGETGKEEGGEADRDSFPLLASVPRREKPPREKKGNADAFERSIMGSAQRKKR